MAMNKDIMDWEFFFSLLNLGIKNGQRSQTALHLAPCSEDEAHNGSPRVSKTVICVKKGRLMVVLDQRMSRLNHREDVLLRRNVGFCVINGRDAKLPRCWSLLAQLHPKTEHNLVLGHDFPNFNVV